MGKLQERENKRKSIIGGMIEVSASPATSTGSRGRPKVDRELKKRISLSVLPLLPLLLPLPHTPEFLLLPLLNSMTNMTSLSSVPVLLVWLAP